MNYEATAKRTVKTIAKYGKPISVERKGTADGWVREYDPAMMCDKWTNNEDPPVVVYVDPATTTVKQNTLAVEENYSADEIDGTMVKTGDRKYLIAADIAEPRKSIDRIVDDGRTLEIIDCKRIAPGSVVLLYEVQCRE